MRIDSDAAADVVGSGVRLTTFIVKLYRINYRDYNHRERHILYYRFSYIHLLTLTSEQFMCILTVLYSYECFFFFNLWIYRYRIFHFSFILSSFSSYISTTIFIYIHLFTILCSDWYEKYRSILLIYTNVCSRRVFKHVIATLFGQMFTFHIKSYGKR